MVVHSEAEEIVQVPVPRRYLDVVYRALADAMGSEAVNSDSIAVEPLAMARGQRGHKQWRKSEIQQLRKLIRTATPRALLDLTTERPNERIPLTAVRERAGRTHEQARADLAGLTQLVRRHFDRDNWPVHIEYAEGGYASYYCSSEDIARWWQSGSD